MFTGIVQGTGTVVQRDQTEGALELTVDLGALGRGLERGASVSVGGVCLTATDVEGSQARFDVMEETLEKTALGSLREGDRVNIERSAKIGDEVGGHVVSGHVSGVVMIGNVETLPGSRVVTFFCDPRWMPFILPKGFVALDGCSLTVVEAGADSFTVHLIPETLERTTFGVKDVGDPAHLEIDPLTQAVVETVRRLVARS